jgi:lipopolysaccharide transport system permease protein
MENEISKNIITKETQIDSNDSEWDLIIRPKRHWFDINLKEIWEYRDLILIFVQRDFVSRYKQTILGPLWFFLNPLLSSSIYSIVFAGFAKIPTDGTPPILFYLSGLVAWNYFAACLNGTSQTFTGNAGIFGKVYFPRLVSPLSGIVSNLFQFGMQFLLLIVLMIIFWFKGFHLTFNIYMLFIPVYLIILAFCALGVGIIISALTVKYRDLTQLMTFGVQLWMYATPVIYPISLVSEKYRIIVLLNPIAPVVEAFKFSLIGAGSINLGGLLYSLVFTMVILIFGIMLFNKVENTFMDTI